MIRGYKVRLFPSVEQEQKMWNHIHSCRFVWNYMLDTQNRLRQNGEKHLSRFSMMKAQTVLKNDGEHDWLYDVSSVSLNIICTDLSKAYDGFFKRRTGFPKFKSRKKSKPSFPIRSESLYFSEEVVNVEKVGKIKYQTNYDFPYGRGIKFINTRISYINDKWILSFATECENQAPELTDKQMGIDLGIKDTATVAFGDEKIVFGNINKSRRVRQMERKVKHLQRNVSRKYNAHKNFQKTNNILKAERKVNQAMSRLTNIRHDYIHKCTHKLVALLPMQVTMEDLNVSGMMKNHHLAKAIQQQKFYEFIRQMRYKCEWYGIKFVQAPRFYPSSKTCSVCGTVKSKLKLSERTFVCESCGAVIDRDYNAAVNLMRYVA